MPNLIRADQKACKGKKHQYPVQRHIAQRGCNLIALHNMLADGSFTTSDYTTFKVFEPKERTVYRLPYYPDRIVHHGIMNPLEQVFTNYYTADSYSCIKGRGIHAAADSLKIALLNRSATTYCLKLDVTKFYPSVNHDILKAQLRRKFKDNSLLRLLDNIIDSAAGLPIGNYLSQHLANFYLTDFDHWLKEQMQVKYYWRYADDMVILHHDKKYLHRLLNEIRSYLGVKLKLTIKPNYQVFPVASRGIDFVGYVFYHTHTYLRKSIKQNMARKRNIPVSAASYYGWAIHCDSRHLLKKLKIYDSIQRLRDKSRIKSTFRGKIKNRKSVQYTSEGIGIRNKTEQGNAGQLSLFAN